MRGRRARMRNALLAAVTDSDQVLVCRLIGGKITLVHGARVPPTRG